MMAGFALVAFGIAYLTTRQLRKLLKVSLGLVEIYAIVAGFLLLFGVSSLMLRQREDGVLVHYIGDPTGYEGAYLYYGLPLDWYRMFEPYDSAFKSRLSNIDSFRFFVDVIVWPEISVALVYTAKFLVARRRRRLLGPEIADAQLET
jgi:hypothetical protein